MPDNFGEGFHRRKKIARLLLLCPSIDSNWARSILYLHSTSVGNFCRLTNEDFMHNHSILLPERLRRYRRTVSTSFDCHTCISGTDSSWPKRIGRCARYPNAELIVGYYLTLRVMAAPLHVWARLWLQVEWPLALFRSSVAFWSILQSSSSIATFWSMLQSSLSSFPLDCVHLMLVHLFFECIRQPLFLHFLPHQFNNSAPNWLPYLQQ